MSSPSTQRPTSSGKRYAYTPYGEVTVLHGAVDADGSVAEWTEDTGGSDIGNEFLYTGRRLDPLAGLYQYRYRYYHAQLGRFVTRDPIGYRGSPYNLYEYVHSKPAILTDPSGQFAGVDYGLYCGFSNRGPGVPIDSLDLACQAHDACLATIWLFINPCLQLYCNSQLCDAATAALTGGCNADWPPGKQRDRCISQALQIQAIACAGAGRVNDPITGDPVQPPITGPVPY